MKIIFYRGDYPRKFNTQTFLGDPVGGTEFAAGYLAQELAQRHQVSFICQTAKEEKIDGIQWMPVNPCEPKSIKRAFQKTGRAEILTLVGGLSNVLDFFTPRVQKVICWANGLSLKPNTISHLLQNRIHQVVCTTKYARDKILANTISRLPLCTKTKYFLAKKWRQNFQNKFTFIYNGVSLNLFADDIYQKIIKRPFKMLYAGVFNEQKNPDKILKVFPEIKRRLPRAELHMCGSIKQYKEEGADKTTGYFDGDEFFARIKSYIFDPRGKIRPGLYLRGALTPPILAREMMSASLVIVNPKVENQESSCIGALEAQAAGTIVLGGGNSALEETIQHQKTGFVFRKQENLAPWIIQILKNPEKVKKLGFAGRRRALAGFGWKKIAKEWEELLEAVINNTKFIPKQH